MGKYFPLLSKRIIVLIKKKRRIQEEMPNNGHIHMEHQNINAWNPTRECNMHKRGGSCHGRDGRPCRSHHYQCSDSSSTSSSREKLSCKQRTFMAGGKDIKFETYDGKRRCDDRHATLPFLCSLNPFLCLFCLLLRLKKFFCP